MSLEVRSLSKSFGDFLAVDDVSFEIRTGEIVGLIGANGAGKSTIVHTILGLVTPTSGSIRIFGMDLNGNRERILARVNFISPYVGFPARMSVDENLAIYAMLYGVRDRAAKIRDLLRRFEIDDLAKEPMTGLSSGESQRVGLCKVFLNKPDLVILDEPLSGLDPHAAGHVRSMLAEIQREFGTTVLHTSHNMNHVEAICNRVIVLERGRIVAEGTPVEVTRRILREDRDESSLQEAFLTLGRRGRRAPS